MHSTLAVLVAIPFGVGIGLVVGTIGGGGAILALPALVYVFGEPVGPASTASLIVVALGASVGAGARARAGEVCWRLALTFSAPAVVGAYVGSQVNSTVSPRVLMLAFVPVMLAAAAVTYMRGGADGDGGGRVECVPGTVGTALVSGLAVGAMTGFFGVGGGFLIVPTLTLLIGLQMRPAIATSLVIITITGLAALASHLASGANPDWRLTAALCAGAAVGALGGGWLSERLDTRTLAHGFGVVVAALALFLLADVAFLGGPPT